MNQLLPADIREHWNFVRPGLEEIAKVDRGEWIPEDLYATVVSGRASLFLTDDDQGFLICQTCLSGYREERVLFLLAAWNRGKDPFGKYWDAIADLARAEKCSVVRFESVRKGFERQKNWNLNCYVLERRV